MLTFFWCLYTLSLLIIFWNQIRSTDSTLSLYFHCLNFTHCFALYGLLDHRHDLLSAPWVWAHHFLFLSWITWRYTSFNQSLSSIQSLSAIQLIRLLVKWGYVGGSLIFLYLTFPWY